MSMLRLSLLPCNDQPDLPLDCACCGGPHRVTDCPELDCPDCGAPLAVAHPHRCRDDEPV
jgi:hypothetical protein